MNQGGVSFGDEAGLIYASSDGSSAHLVVDESAGPFELGGYTLSFWFLLNTLS